MMNRICATWLLALLAVLVSGCGGSTDDKYIIIEPPQIGVGQALTTEGVIQGAAEGSLQVFRGVRYAAPPTGSLRFTAPQALTDYEGVREALTFGPKCIQPQGGTTVGDEDCLFLNIWSHNDDTVRPVMVYLHPGAANGVGGDMSSIDPAELAASEDVVVVNLNRRLGALGYLAIDELISENPLTTAGNYGLLDVIAALQWLQDNLAAFNGDPNRVMLFGTSGGAMTTCYLLGAPAAMGLVQSVAMQSGPCADGTVQVLTDLVGHASLFEPAVVAHRGVLSAVGCDMAADILACLRAMPADEFTLASGAFDLAVPRALFSPLLDRVVVEHPPSAALENMTIGDIPLIIGMAQNEVGRSFDSLDLPDDASYRDYLASRFSDPLDDELYALYPTADYPTPKDAWLMLWADLVFSCSAERLATAGATGAPTYLYEITRGFDTGSQAGQGAYHAIDMPYLFGTFSAFGVTPDSQSLAIRDAMRAAWAGLAADPASTPPISTDDTNLWPVYDSTTSTYAEFGDAVSGQTDHREGRCAALIAVIS